MPSVTRRLISLDTQKLQLGDVEMCPLFRDWRFRLSPDGLYGRIVKLLASDEPPVFGSLNVGDVVPFRLELGYLSLWGAAEIKRITLQAGGTDGPTAQTETVLFEFVADYDAFAIAFGAAEGT